MEASINFLNFYSLSSLPTVISSLLLAVYVYAKNPRQRLNVLWSVMCLLVALWAVCFVVASAARSEPLALWSVRNSYFFAMFIPPVFLHFVLAFLRESANRVLRASGRFQGKPKFFEKVIS